MFNRIAPPASSADCNAAVDTLPAEPLPSTSGLTSVGVAGVAQSKTACAFAAQAKNSMDMQLIVLIIGPLQIILGVKNKDDALKCADP